MEVQIVAILSTSVTYQLQIIAKDIERNVLIVLTWDFVKNQEVSILQKDIEPHVCPEFFIVKGI